MGRRGPIAPAGSPGRTWVDLAYYCAAMSVATQVETTRPPVAPRSRVRAVIAGVAALALLGAGTAAAVWYHHLATAPVIGFAGYWASGAGVKINDDPFHGAWASVPFAPGGSVTLGMEISDNDLDHALTI